MAKFSDIFADVTKLGTKLQTSEYNDSGLYPIVDQGQNDIAGYTNHEEGLFSDVPVVIFGDHTRIVKYIDKPFFLGADGVKVLKAIVPDVDYRYLFYAVSAVRIPDTGYNRHFKWLKDADIPLPDLPTQRRIAATLDKVSEGIAVCRQMLADLDVMVKARFVEMFGDPVTNEMNWPTKSLDEACCIIVDCPHSTPSYTTEDTGYMCIRTSIVKKNRIMWDEIEYIPEQEYLKRIQRKRPEKGDVVYTREGAILGIAAVIDRDCNVALGQRSMLLSPDTKQCTPEFLSVAMNCDTFLDNALKGQSGSASPHINVGDIKAFKMIMPPVEQQRMFSAFIQQADKSKSVVQQQLAELETLKKSLMQEYFG